MHTNQKQNEIQVKILRQGTCSIAANGNAVDLSHVLCFFIPIGYDQVVSTLCKLQTDMILHDVFVCLMIFV